MMNTAAADKTYHFDAVVIGAGVVGLAIARKLAALGKETAVLESGSAFGGGISSRNSEVIHAGLYYAPGSLKARLCVAGRHMLYAYCEARGVACKRLGKLIVAATAEEVAKLHDYQARASQNGVTDLQWLNRAAVAALEPEVTAAAGLFSPSTGIVDTHGLMSALLQDVEQAGGTFVANSPVLGGEIGAEKFSVHVGGREPCMVTSGIVINAAGLGAQTFARTLAGFPAERVPGLHYAVGHYFTLHGCVPFRHLVYPVAASGGLGIHLTLDMAGQARFGPDISWRENEDYSFDASRAAQFYAAIRRYWPALQDDALVPGYTGIRPKLWGKAQPDQDFMIQGPAEHGVAGLVNLFGIESPGLTSCLAIADHVAQLIES